MPPRTGSEAHRVVVITLARALVSLASGKVGTRLTHQIGDGT